MQASMSSVLFLILSIYLLYTYLSVRRSHHVRRDDKEILTLILKNTIDLDLFKEFISNTTRQLEILKEVNLYLISFSMRSLLWYEMLN